MLYTIINNNMGHKEASTAAESYRNKMMLCCGGGWLVVVVVGESAVCLALTIKDSQTHYVHKNVFAEVSII